MWRNEIAMEAGMLYGIDAYNDIRGYWYFIFNCFWKVLECMILRVAETDIDF
jgi:hypothetical protein